MTSPDWGKAISLVESGRPLRVVARQFNISHETLNRRVKANNVGLSRRGPEPRMTTEGEAYLVKWLLLNERLGSCVPMDTFKDKAVEIAIMFGDPSFVAGHDWATRFFARHPGLSKRTPENTERSRLYALHPAKLSEYFTGLKPHLEGRPPTHIWNFDESGFDRKSLNVGKVIATKGSKFVPSKSDGNRDRISYCFFFNAVGDCLSPIVMLPGKEGSRLKGIKAEMVEGFPGANYMLLENSTQTEASWAECATFFVENVAKKYPGGGHLLLLDGHSSRVSLEGINDFRASGNEIFTLPPHSSHVTQPFDVTIAKTFKAELRKAYNRIRVGNVHKPGESIGNKNVMTGWRMAFKKTMEVREDTTTGEEYTLASRGFAKCGIYPFNPSIIEERYSAAAVHFVDEIESKMEAPVPMPMTERAAAVEKATAQILEAGDAAVLLAKHVKTKRASAVPGCTLLTGDEHIAKAMALEQVKQAEVAATSEKREARQKASAEAKVAKEERRARVAAKKAAKAAAAAEGLAALADADAASNGSAVGKGGKRKRARAVTEEEDAVEAARKGAAGRRAARWAARTDDGDDSE